MGFTLRREKRLNLLWEESQRGGHKMAKKENPNKNKHLTGEQRKEVEECLAKRMTFKAIGRFLEKDPTTISYEVKHHRTEH